MCGIVGILRMGDKSLPEPNVVRRMMSAIDYRGPDDSGEFRSDDVHLGVVRLAIVDPKEGNQPVTNCNDDVVAVYNGETYNHHALRRNLVRNGHSMSSQCDSETIPHLYEEHGVDLVEKLRGMFAFALWDASEKRLLLARDRMGIKPLYYAVCGDHLVFASEIKAILLSGLVEPEIDTDSVDDVFSMSYPCAPRTMFRGVYELLPAHVLTVGAGRRDIATKRYWRSPVPHAGEHAKLSKNEAAEELRSMLRLRVYEHTMADVPVAAYLSGGLDSSAICSLIKDVSGDAPTTFSVAFDSPEHDEYAAAKEMANYLGSENHVLRCDQSMAGDLERMVWHTEMPLQFPLALPMMRLSELARSQRYPVVLSGEGADEIMGGYDCFRGDKMRRIFDRPGLRFLRPALYKQLYKWLEMPKGTVDVMLANQLKTAQTEKQWGGIVPPWYDVWTTIGIDRQQLLGSSGRKVRPADEAPEGFANLLPDDLSKLHPLDAAISLEQATRLPSWILLIADRAAMANSVETRVPLLDHEIVEFVASLPPSMKMQGLQEKAILRKATTRMMPPSLNSRRKRPFYTPIHEWFFSKSAPEFVRDALSPEAIRDAGLFDSNLVAKYQRDLQVADPKSLMKNRLEWTLILILQTQILHKQFVKERCLSAPALSAIV